MSTDEREGGTVRSREDEPSPTGPGAALAETMAASSETIAASSEAVSHVRAGSHRSERPNARQAAPVPSSPIAVDVADARLDGTTDFDTRYRQRKTLAAGGMGEVLVCRDARIGREVALKLIRRERAQEQQMRARFLREARVQGQLDHPDVVPVYDLGICPDGDIYFTMKRVRGRTLEEVLELLQDGDVATRRELSRRKLLSMFASLCLAVDFAHARGVIHRDLKPANIMLGDFGEVYLLDWGIAKFIDGDQEASNPAGAGVAPDGLKTAAGAISGTPGFMAPEQVHGSAVPDVRSDVYSLGSILFELLALEPLHLGNNAAEVLESTVDGVDGRPSARAPDLEVPPELDLLCQRATALEVAARPPSARALSEAVERFLDGDRDFQLRRDLAQEHAALASERLPEALSGAAEAREARGEAMRAVGRALALDPTNTQATQAMVQLLTELPKEMPVEASETMQLTTAQHDRVAARGAVVIYLGTALLYGLLVLWLGMRDWGWASAMLVGFGTAALLSHLDSKSTGTRYEYWVLIASVLGIIASSRMFGPLIVVPSYALGNTLGFALTPRKRRRALFVAAGCLAFLVPVALEWIGVLPDSYRFVDGTLTLMPHMHDLPAIPTLVAILLISTLTTVGGAMFVGDTRDALSAAERKLHLHAWQLQQMLPRGAGPESKQAR